MKPSPRAKLLALIGLFMLPIVASVLAYNFLDLRPTANYGELIMPPPPAPAERLAKPDGTSFTFQDLAGRWVLVSADPGPCDAACRAKLVILRQVRQALGRNASRVERVLLITGSSEPSAEVLEPFPGMLVVLPGARRAPPPLGQDAAHIYLIDPNGNVMMRWPAAPDPRRMLKDLERLLKASQIG